MFPPVKHVLDKFRHKLPKDELKRLGKEIAKKLVASDYKNNRVGDPTAKLTEKQTGNIKKYVKNFLDRAVQKYDSHQKRKAIGDTEMSANGGSSSGPAGELRGNEPTESPLDSPATKEAVTGGDARDDAVMSDGDEASPNDSERKRKRVSELDTVDSTGVTPSDGPELKRLKENDVEESSPPPPPPPPPELALEETVSEEQRALAEQEEALMRENEEAQRLDDEANETKRLEDATDGMKKDIAVAKSTLGANGEANGSSTIDEHSAQKQEVLSH